MSSDPLMEMFHRAGTLQKALQEVADDDLKDYPGSTPPRNRPGGDKYESRRALQREEKTYEYATEDGIKTFYTIKTVCRIFGRKPVTIRSWEDKGILPKPKYRTPAPRGKHLGSAPKGRRLYTQNQVDYLESVCDRYRMLEPNKADWKGFKKAMQDYPAD